MNPTSGGHTLYGGSGNDVLYGGDGVNIALNPSGIGLVAPGGDGTDEGQYPRGRLRQQHSLQRRRW